jgi:outer membrane protein assembly factor BamE (lipoprotein component of BamABCDE complex)
MMKLRPTRPLVAIALLAAILATPGCNDLANPLSFPIQARGNHVDSEQLSQLVPGTSTKGDVQALLGSPTTRATFDDNTWLYISALTKPVIGATNRIQQQTVVALSFDDSGVLRGVTQRNQEDSLPVQIVSRTTPTPGNETTFMQQLLGNIGRFSPGGTGGRPSGGNY